MKQIDPLQEDGVIETAVVKKNFKPIPEYSVYEVLKSKIFKFSEFQTIKDFWDRHKNIQWTLSHLIKIKHLHKKTGCKVITEKDGFKLYCD